MAPRANDDRPHAVYRCYDAADRLLYIGCSADLADRFRQHEQGPGYRWLPHVERIDLEWVGPRLEARRAETKAINDEVPLFNRVDAEAWGAVDPERGAKYVEEHGLPDVPLLARGAGFRRAYIVRTEAVARIRGAKAQPWPIA